MMREGSNGAARGCARRRAGTAPPRASVPWQNGHRTFVTKNVTDFFVRSTSSYVELVMKKVHIRPFRILREIFTRSKTRQRVGRLKLHTGIGLRMRRTKFLPSPLLRSSVSRPVAGVSFGDSHRARHFPPRGSPEPAARVIGTSRRVSRVERVDGEGEHPRFFSCRSPGAKIHPPPVCPQPVCAKSRASESGPPCRTREAAGPRDHSRARRKSPRGFSPPSRARTRERFRERVAPTADRLRRRGHPPRLAVVSERSSWRTIPSTSTLGTAGRVRLGAGRRSSPSSR